MSKSKKAQKDSLPINKKNDSEASHLFAIVFTALVIISAIIIFLKYDDISNNIIKRSSKSSYNNENIQSAIYEVSDSLYIDKEEDAQNKASGTVKVSMEEENIDETNKYSNIETKVESNETEILRLKNEVLASDAKIQTLEKEIQNLKMNNYLAPLVVSIVELKNMANDGKNFQEEIDNVEYLANGNSVILIALDKIKPYSNGIKTIDNIKKDFNNLVNKIFQSERAPEENADWVTKLKYNLTKDIVIRKVDKTMDPSQLENIVINAEEYVNQGDYKNAIYEIQKLSEKNRILFDGWIKETAEHLYVNSILDGLLKYMREL